MVRNAGPRFDESVDFVRASFMPEPAWPGGWRLETGPVPRTGGGASPSPAGVVSRTMGQPGRKESSGKEAGPAPSPPGPIQAPRVPFGETSLVRNHFPSSSKHSTDSQ